MAQKKEAKASILLFLLFIILIYVCIFTFMFTWSSSIKIFILFLSFNQIYSKSEFGIELKIEEKKNHKLDVSIKLHMNLIYEKFSLIFTSISNLTF